MAIELPPRSNTCKSYTAKGLPARIPPGNETSGTTESTYDSLDHRVTFRITILDSFTVVEVDVVNLIGTHEYMGDLQFYIVAPSNHLYCHK